MISIQCALCAKKQKIIELFKENFSEERINTVTFSARRAPDRIHYRIVKCVNCGLIFSNPILSLKKILNLYKESKFTYNTESKFLRKTYGEYLKEILPKNGLSKINLLEIGCGNGFFLEEAMEMGVKNVFGIEPSKDSINKTSDSLRGKIKRDVLRPNVYKNKTFDIICFFHTLDHIVDPNSFLSTVNKLLKKGGKVICVVHNTDGISVKLFGEKSPIFDIEHIYLFNKSNVSRIFKKNGLKPIKVGDVKDRYPLKYWLKLTPFPRTFKRAFGLVFLTGIGNIPISVKAGNIVLIAKKTS